MKSIRKLLDLPLPDYYLLAESSLLVAAVRLGLWVLPFRTVHASLIKLTRVTSKWLRKEQRFPIDRITWAVTVTSRYIPGATCLTQALAAKVLLGQFGYPARVRVGVAREAPARLQAHAWVESEGRVVLGGPEVRVKRYTLLSASSKELI